MMFILYKLYEERKRGKIMPEVFIDAFVEEVQNLHGRFFKNWRTGAVTGATVGFFSHLNLTEDAWRSQSEEAYINASIEGPLRIVYGCIMGGFTGLLNSFRRDPDVRDPDIIDNILAYFYLGLMAHSYIRSFFYSNESHVTIPSPENRPGFGRGY